MTKTQDELMAAVERLAEIAAAVEFAPGDGIAFSEEGAIKHASDLRLILAALRSPDPEVERLNTAREAFFDLIADAQKWEEESDEDGFHYELRFGHHSLLPLMTAFGVERLSFPLVVDEEMFMGRETPAEALYRASNASIDQARAALFSNSGGR